MPVKTPKVIIFNQNLSKELNLDFSQVDKKLALIFSGNQLPAGSGLSHKTSDINLDILQYWVMAERM